MLCFYVDIVLKDKVFVYDLAQQRIGWVNHDCKPSPQIYTLFC